MKRNIEASSQNTKLIVQGFLIWFGFLVACAFVLWGIYLGDEYRETVLKVEYYLFGEKKPSLPIEIDAEGSLITTSTKTPDNSQKELTVGDKIGSASKQAATRNDVRKPPNRADKPASLSKHEADAPQPQATPRNDQSESIQKADPTSGSSSNANEDNINLANLRGVPVIKQIKVLVADGYAASQPDWIAQAVRAVSTASQIYDREFGIELRVIAVVRWLDALPDMTNDELLSNLKKHPREGADMLLGFVDKELEGDMYSQGLPDSNSHYNGACGLIGRTTASQPAFLAGVLRGVGRLLGAEQVTDTESEGYRLGSWMSDARQPADRPPWIDIPNRKRILLRKSLPSWNPADTDP